QHLSGAAAAARRETLESVAGAISPDPFERDDRRDEVTRLGGKALPDAVVVAVAPRLLPGRLLYDARDAVLPRVVRRRREVPAAEAVVEVREERQRRVGLLLDVSPLVDFLVDAQPVQVRGVPRELPHADRLFARV